MRGWRGSTPATWRSLPLRWLGHGDAQEGDAYRAILIRGEAPHFASLGIVAGVGVVQLWAFHWIFQRASAGFVEEF